MQAHSGTTASGHPYAEVGAGAETLVVIGGIEPKHVVPDGLHLQGIANAFKPLAEVARVVVIKRPPEMERGYSQAQMASDYGDAIFELAPSASVMGIAAGGTIAQFLAAQRPDLVQRLILVATAYRVSEPGREVLSRAVALAENRDYRAMNRLMIERLYPSRVASAFYGALAWLIPGLSGDDDPDEFICEAEAAAAASTRESLAKIDAPALLLTGDRDFFYDAGDVAVTAQEIRTCEPVVFKNQGHGLPRTRAEEIARRVGSFISA